MPGDPTVDAENGPAEGRDAPGDPQRQEIAAAGAQEARQNGVLGSIAEFSQDIETWESYCERFEQFVIVNKMPENDRVPCLLSVMGPTAYSLLRTLTAPIKPKDKTFEQIVSTMQNHLSPRPLIIAERFRFYNRCQKSGETVAQYAAELRRLADNCNFGDFLDQALRDKLVCGLTNEHVKKRLLTEVELTFQRAHDLAVSMEVAQKDTNELARSRNVHSCQASKKNYSHKHATPDEKKTHRPTKCQHCGGEGHNPNRCWFKDQQCYKCGKRGHMQAVCKAKPKQKTGKANRKTLHNVDGNSGSDSEDERLFALKTGQKSAHATTADPITKELQIEGSLVKMEVDTGSSLSVMQYQQYCKLFPHVPLQRSNVRFKMYNQSRTYAKGVAQVEVEHRNKFYVLPLYIIDVASANYPLLGRDWLQMLTPDTYTELCINQISDDRSPAKALSAIMREYSEVFSDEMGTLKGMKAHLTVSPEAKPKFMKARPVPFAKRPQVEEKLQLLEKAAIIEKVKYSKWACPIVTPPKKDGGLRICGDFKTTVNPVLEADKYPLPRIEEIFANLSGGVKFSKIDLRQAYLQMEVDENSQEYLTINTHLGLYRYKRLAYGIKTAPSIWQRAMDQVLSGLPMTQCYLDDIIVTGKSDQEHLKNLTKVLARLQEYGLKVNKEKCTFFKDAVTYLGHVIDARGLHKLQDKVEAVVSAPAPENIQQLKAWLGLVQYYHKFLPNLSSRLKPLHELLEKGRKWYWSSRQQKAFNSLKQEMSADTVLTHYNPEMPLYIACDASPYGIAAVLSHVIGNEERPIAFASRTLTKAEQNYAQIEREGLGIVWGLTKFHQYLEGRHFTIITDNQPLSAIFNPRKGIPINSAARITRWAVFLSGFDYDIKLRKTQEHGNVDALSRLPLPMTEKPSDTDAVGLFFNKQISELPVSTRDIREYTRRDSQLAQILQFLKHGWPRSSSSYPELQNYFTHKDELTLHDGCIMWGERVVIPRKLRGQILQDIHEGHLGVVKTKSIARSYVWWPKIDNEIETLTKQCQGCQQTLKNPPKTSHTWETPSGPWQRVHIDFAGPVHGHMYLVIVDAYSKWPEVIKMTSTTSEKTIDVLRSVFARFGVPEQLVSDNGPQFTSEEFQHFMKHLGIKHRRGAPYHPATNGLAERFVQTFKKSLKIESSAKLLDSFLLAYRNAAHAISGQSPAMLMFGRPLRTRLDLLRPNIQKKMSDQHPISKSAREFIVGEEVLARNYSPGSKWVRGTIERREGQLTYYVNIDGLVWKRHVNQLLGVNDNPPEEREDKSSDKSDISSDKSDVSGDMTHDRVYDRTPDRSAPMTHDGDIAVTHDSFTDVTKDAVPIVVSGAKTQKPPDTLTPRSTPQPRAPMPARNPVASSPVSARKSPSRIPVVRSPVRAPPTRPPSARDKKVTKRLIEEM